MNWFSPVDDAPGHEALEDLGGGAEGGLHVFHRVDEVGSRYKFNVVLHMTGFTGSRDYVGTPQSPQKTPHISTLRPSRCWFCAGCELFEVTSNPHITRNERVGVSFFSGIGVGYSAETAGSLHHPETRRNPPYVDIIPGPKTFDHEFFKA